MANLRITEYDSVIFGMPGYQAPIPMEPARAEQNITFTTAASSSAFDSKTRFVRLVADANCHVKFSTNSTEATADMQPLSADTEYWRGIPNGAAANYTVSVYDGSS